MTDLAAPESTARDKTCHSAASPRCGLYTHRVDGRGLYTQSGVVHDEFLLLHALSLSNIRV